MPSPFGNRGDREELHPWESRLYHSHETGLRFCCSGLDAKAPYALPARVDCGERAPERPAGSGGPAMEVPGLLREKNHLSCSSSCKTEAKSSLPSLVFKFCPITTLTSCYFIHIQQ